MSAPTSRGGSTSSWARASSRKSPTSPIDRPADVYNNLGVALRAQGRLKAAFASYQRSLALRPDHSDVYSNLGNALRELGRLNDAAANHQQAVRLSPGSAQAIYNLGLILRDLGHLNEALACFDKALEIDPDFVYCHWDRFLALLLRGDFEEGFAEYEWRWKLPHNPPRGYTQPHWDGAALDGRTIFVHQEQGLGDMI
ncbi:MAG: tetratricopeptide repeat protein [Rhodospirillales bacterium]|nr:tetratricopeptide repeat protein [Rhodospirillales bacterium]